MKEEWKIAKIIYPTTTHPNLIKYEVSNLGHAKKNGKEIILKHGGDTSIGGKRLYRWVAELFIPNPENKPCVDHFDRDHNNNTVLNLRWVTYYENNNNPNTKTYRNDGHINYDWPHKSYKHSEETKKRLSEIMKEYYKTHVNPFKNKHFTEEQLKKISDRTKEGMKKVPREKLQGTLGKHKVWDDETHTKFHYE